MRHIKIHEHESHEHMAPSRHEDTNHHRYCNQRLGPCYPFEQPHPLSLLQIRADSLEGRSPPQKLIKCWWLKSHPCLVQAQVQGIDVII
jgi:hypothetical protein